MSGCLSVLDGTVRHGTVVNAEDFAFGLCLTPSRVASSAAALQSRLAGVESAVESTYPTCVWHVEVWELEIYIFYPSAGGINKTKTKEQKSWPFYTCALVVYGTARCQTLAGIHS